MMNTPYIKRVLDHIKSKEQRSVIEAELYDHIQCRCEHFEDIGYDDKAANEMTEELMGDPDIVGEQLNEIKRRKAVGNIAMLVISIICFLSCIAIKIITDYKLNNYYNSIFFIYMMEWIAYITFMIVLIIDVRKGLPFSSIITAAGICYLEKYSYYIVNTPVLLITDSKRLFQTFFAFVAYDASYFYFPKEVLNYGVMIALYLAAFIPALITLFTSVRARRLNNKRLDIKLKKISVLFLAVIIVTASAMLGLVTFTAFSKEKTMIYDAHEAMIEVDSLVLDNLDIVLGKDDKAAVDFLEENTPDGAQFNKDFWEENGEYGRSASIIYNGITLTAEYDKEGISYLDISPTVTGLKGTDPEIITDYDQKSAEAYKGELSDAPKPCMIELNRDYGIIRLRYASYSYDRGKYIEYSFKNGKAEFSENVFRNGKSVKLTVRQKKYLMSALDDYYRNRNFDKYLDYEGDAFIKFFGTGLDEVNDIYKIDMYYNPEWAAIIDGNLYDLKIDNNEGFCSFKVKFTDKKAEIISELFAKDYGSIEDVYSAESNKELDGWKERRDITYYHLKRIEKRYDQKVYGVITEVEDDGTIHYFRYNDYDISTVPETKEEIMKRALSSTFEPPVDDKEQTTKKKQ